MDFNLIQMMMRRLFIFLFMLCSVWASAQITTQYLGGNNTLVVNRGHFSSDSSFLPPVRDTTFTPSRVGALVFRSGDNSYYGCISLSAAKKWERIGSGGGSTDTTFLSARINAKQNSIFLGTTSQYFRGDLSLSDFASDVLAVTDGAYASSTHSHNGLIPLGGLTGQVLKKATNSDYDYYWGSESSGGGSVSSVFDRYGAITAQATDYAAFYPSLTGYNKTNWDNAYSWGNHASAGYLKGVDTVSLSNRINNSFTSIAQVNDSTFTLNRPNGTKDTVLISFTAGSSAVSLSNQQTILGTNPTLTPGSSSQILSITLSAGTWMVTAQAEFFSPSNTEQNCTMQIWAGGTQAAEAKGMTPAIASTSKYLSLHASSIVTVSSTTTLHLDVVSDVASIVQSNGKATQLNAVKIAP